MSDPTPDPTPDDSGAAKALRSEREARKALERELAELRSTVAQRDRAEVVRETGLPEALADRLTGDTPEELRADAERLMASIPAREPVVPASANQGRSDSEPALDHSQIADRILDPGGI